MAALGAGGATAGAVTAALTAPVRPGSAGTCGRSWRCQLQQWPYSRCTNATRRQTSRSRAGRRRQRQGARGWMVPALPLARSFVRSCCSSTLPVCASAHPSLPPAPVKLPLGCTTRCAATRPPAGQAPERRDRRGCAAAAGPGGIRRPGQGPLAAGRAGGRHRHCRWVLCHLPLGVCSCWRCGWGEWVGGGGVGLPAVDSSRVPSLWAGHCACCLYGVPASAAGGREGLHAAACSAQMQHRLHGCQRAASLHDC